ncbi:hypothetical protein IA57_05560 [Mangrovimonas yunxiaonensis]|uniref:DUF6705 domain-containing protein n=1 Tax=Mangrovimonas yunxiaonensis TaxID=1197477 RepID=A0A084TKR1_9FLAO|nr:DUF6705 family protein [Mangrovimonas yunxiaonensis]KFB01297.1 hypothetical protein IA57_05560 [Mangrovimonas yunxiaonensis]GGH37523.1 hypothetical protein GCM10011364_05570 [Mangrovimonas yunxiaonensis]
MKSIIKVIFILFLVSCKAQNIIPLYNEGNYPNYISGVPEYYKDVGNDFNPYVGTWSGNLGNDTLTITFNKVVNFLDSSGDYFDFLVGEFRYEENGQVLVDTYPEIISNDPNGVPLIINPNPWNNSINSTSIRTYNRGFPPCPECAPNTRFIFLSIVEPNDIWGKIRMARFEENGVEKLRMRITNTYAGDSPNELSIPENSIWTLVKQE